MIYHIIRGNVLHTSPILVKELIATSNKISPSTSEQHYYCVIMFDNKMLYDNACEEPYTAILREKKEDKYKLFYSKWQFLKFLLGIPSKDKVLIHGNTSISFQFISYVSLLFFRNKLLRRMSLVCWGNNDYVQGSKIRTKLSLGLLRSIVYSKFKYVIALSSEDRNVVSALYPRANVVYLPYLGSDNVKLNRALRIKKKTRVMVSHSGWKENNHRKSFDLLSKFKSKIEVVCPLCYGDANYISDTITYGKQLFGEDFYYFQDLIPNEEYSSFLQEIDIYVTAAERQTGLGTLFRTMSGGSKIYVSGNLLRSLQSEGYIVFDINSICTIEYELFAAPLSDFDAQKNVDVLNQTRCLGKDIIGGWRRIYEY